MRDGVVVVGAGECGTRAVFALRAEGFTGPATLVGDEPGLPYERPPLSKTFARTPLCDAAMLRDAGITLLSGVAATGIDPAAHRVDLSDGRTLGYGALLLATGSRARRLPFGGGRVHVLRSHADAQALRTRLEPGVRVVVVGGGFIGLELAAAASALGCRVTVLELGPTVMGRAVPARVAAAVAERHRAAGVDVRCSTAVTGMAEAGPVARVQLGGGGVVEAEVVVAGVGAVPETGLAEAAGMRVEDGIVVDERFATSAPDVYAAGDCCSYPHPSYGTRLRLESWRAAQEHGDAAARTILGGTEPHTGIPWFWSDQYELSLQVAGLPGAAVDEVVRHRPDGVEIWFGLDGGGRLVAAAGVGPGTSVARDVRVAELLIARRAAPAPAVLADPAAALKPLLRAPAAA